MNKTELTKQAKELVAQELKGVTIKDTCVFVDATLKALQDGLITEGKVSIAGFGSFELVERPERKGRNPKDGSEIMIPASKTIKFKAGKAFKDMVNA